LILVLPTAAPAARALPGIYLHPGQIAVSAKPCVVETLLGSCVAVGVWDPVAGIGGMNHYLLPRAATAAVATPRFGDVATDRLITRVVAAGAAKERLRARLFGGASVLQALRGVAGSLGRSNVDMARNVLADFGIPILSLDVEGERGRKVVFHTHDGESIVRLLAGERNVRD
jgi:chemotaxis protein CheD